MVEPELDLGPRSRSVSRCESRSQSRRSSVMSVRSEDDLDCSWRVWRSSRRRLSINVVLLWNIFLFWNIFHFTVLSERRKSSVVSISGEDHGVKSVGNMSRSISRLGRILGEVSETKVVRGRTFLSNNSSRSVDLTLHLTSFCPSQPRQGPPEDAGGPRYQAQPQVWASHHVCRLHQDTGGPLKNRKNWAMRLCIFSNKC